jgi:hypothetical protein
MHVGQWLRDAFEQWVVTGEIDETDYETNKPVTLARLVGRLWNCTDVMPSSVCRGVDEQLKEHRCFSGSSYAQPSGG